MNRTLPLFLVVALMVVAGCASRDTANDPLPPPWPEDEAPARLQALVHDFQAYQAETGHLPMSLAVLDDSHLATGGPWAATRMAYHSAGLAVLREGWRLVAVDDRRCEPGRVWCVVRPPVRVANTPRFRVVRISVAELRESGAEN